MISLKITPKVRSVPPWGGKGCFPVKLDEPPQIIFVQEASTIFKSSGRKPPPPTGGGSLLAFYVECDIINGP